MARLSVGQRKSLAEFFTNGAVAWLSAGVIAPFFIEKTATNFISSLVWGTIFTIWFILISLLFTRGVKT